MKYLRGICKFFRISYVHRLEYNFVTAVLSEYQPSRSLAHVVQVDCIQNLDTALLLHLKTNADFRSYVLPSRFVSSIAHNQYVIIVVFN